MKKFFHLTNLVLITLISYLAVIICYRGLTAAFAVGVNPVALYSGTDTIQPQNVENHPVAHYRAISRRNLFHTQGKGAAGPVEKLDALKQTELNLKLWGTVSTARGDRFAVIEGKTDTTRTGQHLFKEGDSVAGAVVKKILDEKVVLSINGENELLALEKYHSPHSRAYRYSSARRPIKQVRRLRRAQVEKAMGNINEPMKQAVARPHRYGIQLVRIKGNSIFRRLGLRNGDVITGVNGERIRSVHNALSLYENLKSSDNVTLQFKRRGRDWSIRYKIM